MKSIFSLRRHDYLKIIGTFLIAIALIAGVVGCEGDGEPDKYELTMAVSPASGGTATDLTDASPYEENTTVNINAAAAPCYQFVSWTSSAGGQFGNSSAPETTFTMPDNDVTVTANFAIAPLDHFRCYYVDSGTAPDPNKEVGLVDQFHGSGINAIVRDAVFFGNPVKKEKGAEVTPISNPNNHYTFYYLDYAVPPEEQSLHVTVNNQFGDNQELIVSSIPLLLGVPTQKEGHDQWDCLDHLLVYYVIDYPETPATVNLTDQFGDTEQGVDVYYPALFANPVKKIYGGDVADIVNPNVENHVVFYTTDKKDYTDTVDVSNQFGEQSLTVDGSEALAVPSEKISWWEELDHFTSYSLSMVGPVEKDVRLVDQWVDINTTAMTPILFCNPAMKIYDDKETPIRDEDHHLTVYNITNEEFGYWEVTVNNQFGDQQLLTVKGPVALAVPTWKQMWMHDEPVGLDHYTLYEVTDHEQSGTLASVFLSDQFIELVPPYDPVPVDVLEPVYFAMPVQKTLLPGGIPTEIENETAHLLFYKVTPHYSPWGDPLWFTNQFVTDYKPFMSVLQYLVVPSMKVSYNPVP